jgi:geranylgeranyl pyrophosphate synthase
MREISSPLIADAMGQVEALIARALTSQVPLLHQAARLAISSGGKRLRPTVLLLAQRAVGDGETALAVQLAAAVELVHTASLVHDDINDRSDLRRGQPAVHTKWGSAAALLVGDFVFVRMLDLMADAGEEAIRLLAQACNALVEGETLQLLSAWDASLTVERYLENVDKKTATLLATCAELGALAAGAPADEREALRSYGRHLGLAYQVRDDTLDFIGDQERLGKPSASDLDLGLLSLPALHALRVRPELAACVRERNLEPLRAAIFEIGGIKEAMAVARSQAESAMAALASLPHSDAREELLRLASWTAQRER